MSVLGSLGPAALVTRAYRRLLDQVPAPDAWSDVVRAAEARGPVVYVVRNTSLLDLVTLDHLTRRQGLRRVGFSNELGGWVDVLSSRSASADRLEAALTSNKAALLFLRRPPSVFDRAGAQISRGKSEGDELLRAVVALQRRLARPIQMIPQLFVWTQRPERLGFSLVDVAFGPSEFPGDLRSAGQFLLNHKNCVVRAGEVVDVRELCADEGDADDAVVARRLGYSLVRKLERERRAVLGPAQKPPDRVREEVLRSPKLQTIIKDLAGSGAAERETLLTKAREMLDELKAAPDPTALRGLELATQTLVDRLYAGVDVDVDGLERVRAAARRGSLVYLPSHKSHVDYILLSFVLRKAALQVPVIAAGDNLQFFPVGPIFRAAGAFFIRRSFKGDRLYTAVVDAYIRRLIKDGHAIEFFLEGGRSRLGKLLAPKLGLLNMVVDAALSVEDRAVSFVPVSIGYERVVETGSYARELSGGQKRKEDAAALLALGKVLGDTYGRVNVQFGQVLDLDAMLAEIGAARGALTPPRRRAVVTRIAHRAMSEINRVTAVTPGSLVATVLLGHARRGMPHVDLVGRCARLVHLVRHLGAPTSPTLTRGEGGSLREGAIRDAALLYVKSGQVLQHVPGETLTGPSKQRARIYTGEDVIYTVPDDQRLSLDISKNLIVHLFVDRALVAVALAGGSLARAELADRVRWLSRLFKYEFMFRADAAFEVIFTQTLDAMRALGELAWEDDDVRPGAGHDGISGAAWLAFYAAVVRNFLESYRVAARTTRVLLKGPLAEKDLAARALRVGEQMFLGGEIERAEAVSQPVLENAFTAFAEQGFLARTAGKLALAPSFANPAAAATIEARIHRLLDRREPG